LSHEMSTTLSEKSARVRLMAIHMPLVIGDNP
jgi:hypothetical protein